jgi:Mrp family chromosome partitioning ATPase
MAKMMNIPVLGIIENMSWLSCPDCGKKIFVFGESRIDETARELGVPVLAKLPIESKTAALVDKGAGELADAFEMKGAVEFIKKFIEQ